MVVIGHRSIAERYAVFARICAEMGSPQYVALCEAVAGSAALQSFIAQFPEPRQQPNLFLAALRVAAGLPASAGDLEALVATHGEAIADLMRRRVTQTNEPGRCATLLPVLAGIEGPIALLEVGASAGLCLLPDHYGYDYGSVTLPGAPVMSCRADAATPLPRAKPEVVWRAGIDLSPIDTGDAGDCDWLRALVWPEQIGRAERLDAALALARRVRPRVVQGDLTRDLPALAGEAPKDATLVIFHTAVLVYVAEQARLSFAEQVRDLGAVWICNEDPQVFPAISAKAPPPPDASSFLMAVDARPVAWTHPHGATLSWIGG